MFTYGFQGKKYKAEDRYFKLFKAYYNIESYRDLKKAKITHAEWEGIPYLLHDLAQYGFTQTFSSTLSAWFVKNGCHSELDDNKINYVIFT